MRMFGLSPQVPSGSVHDRLIIVTLLFAFIVPACGGTASQQDAHRPEEGSANSDGYGTSGEGEGATEKSSEAVQPSGPDCSDGTCFACGEGVCPSGAYCDQDAEGGAACAWLAECSQTPSCGCIKKILGSACRCGEESGPTVSCK
jgi:hypothetical protein